MKQKNYFYLIEDLLQRPYQDVVTSVPLRNAALDPSRVIVYTPKIFPPPLPLNYYHEWQWGNSRQYFQTLRHRATVGLLHKNNTYIDYLVPSAVKRL